MITRASPIIAILQPCARVTFWIAFGMSWLAQYFLRRESCLRIAMASNLMLAGVCCESQRDDGRALNSYALGEEGETEQLEDLVDDETERFEICSQTRGPYDVIFEGISDRNDKQNRCGRHGQYVLPFCATMPTSVHDRILLLFYKHLENTFVIDAWQKEYEHAIDIIHDPHRAVTGGFFRQAMGMPASEYGATMDLSVNAAEHVLELTFSVRMSHDACLDKTIPTAHEAQYRELKNRLFVAIAADADNVVRAAHRVIENHCGDKN